jgi:hypothetical protein
VTAYLFESPWLAFALLAVALLIVLLLLRGNQRPGLFAMAAILLLLLPVPFLLDYLVVTPAEQIEQVVDELVAATLAGDPGPVVARISPQYNFGGETHASLTAMIKTELSRLRFQSIGINGREVTADASAGRASFVAVVAGNAGSYGVDHYPIRLTLSFEQSPDGWQIVRIQRFEPVVNTDQEIPLGRR